MKTHESWTKFLDDIERARKELGCEKNKQESWFRGHTNGDIYKLLPSLFRCFQRPDEAQRKKKGEWYKVRQVESDLFYEFSTRAREAHASEMSDWDILFAMQHYETPTRLLDWTEVLGVAVFFAVLDVKDEEPETPDPCVWVLNPYRLNKISWDLEDIVSPPFLGWDDDDYDYWTYGEMVASTYNFGWDSPVAIFPRQKTERMRSQKAWFTIHGDDHVPMEEIARVRKHALRKVRLPKEAIEAARSFLGEAGLSHYSIFPDLANLSIDLKKKYDLKPISPIHKKSPELPRKDSGKGAKKKPKKKKKRKPRQKLKTLKRKRRKR